MNIIHASLPENSKPESESWADLQAANANAKALLKQAEIALDKLHPLPKEIVGKLRTQLPEAFNGT